jgi:hypothetical protein
MALAINSTNSTHVETSEVTHVSNIYNIVVHDDSEYQVMETYHYESEPYCVEAAFSTLYNYLSITHDFDSHTQCATVYNPLAIFEWKARKPKHGIDYVIRDIATLDLNSLLFCKRRDLSVGDVVMLRHKNHIVQVNDKLLQPANEQGYFSYQLVGGFKYDLFMQARESVATYSRGARRWHFSADKYHHELVEMSFGE